MIAAWDVEVMTMQTDLAKQIEDPVRHVEVLRTSAAAAVARAFATRRRSRRRERARRASPLRTRKKAAPRRAPEELIALGERFYTMLCQQPGETMMTLAPKVGVAPRVLQVAVARLRREGRVRVVRAQRAARARE